MESGEITAEQIIASSQYNSNWSPERSRLNYHENGWTPSDDTIREWIQVSSALLQWSRRFGSGGSFPSLISDLASGRNIVHSSVRVRRTTLGQEETGRHPLWINICLGLIVESDLALQPRNNIIKQVGGEVLSQGARLVPRGTKTAPLSNTGTHRGRPTILSTAIRFLWDQNRK